MSQHRVAAATLTIALSAGLLIAVPTTADAARTGCISRAEYHRVKQDMTRPKVKQITRATGSTGGPYGTQDYRIERYTYDVCTSRSGSAELGFVSAMGGPFELTRKTVHWK